MDKMNETDMQDLVFNHTTAWHPYPHNHNLNTQQCGCLKSCQLL